MALLAPLVLASLGRATAGYEFLYDLYDMDYNSGDKAQNSLSQEEASRAVTPQFLTQPLNIVSSHCTVLGSELHCVAADGERRPDGAAALSGGQTGGVRLAVAAGR